MNTSTTEPTTEDHFRRFTSIVTASGIRESLVYLVSLTDYRFISIFRTQGDMATTVVHYDRENPDVMSADELPAEGTYCCFVAASGKTFSTENSLQDARLTGHAQRDSLLSYCGVPILNPDGQVLGTLCHYDVVPRTTDQLDFGLLIQVASALHQRDLLPTYPS
jgi:GAF domain-containing protein